MCFVLTSFRANDYFNLILRWGTKNQGETLGLVVTDLLGFVWFTFT